jgi:hypothetical protein
MGRFLHIDGNKVVIEVGKAGLARKAEEAGADPFTREMEAIARATIAGRPTVPSFVTLSMSPREEVMKAASAAYQKASFAADQSNGGAPAGVGAGAPKPIIPEVVTISVDDLRREETPSEQEFVPSDVRASNDLAKARRNAARSPYFSNPFDLARDA